MSDERHDVIVVLGAAQNPDGSPGPAIVRRVRHAVRCWQAGRAPVIMLCGGPTVIATSEAEAMADVARAEGARAEGAAGKALLLEAVSTRTLENAEQCLRVMGENGLSRALLVTDWFHMPRALYTFRAFGIEVTPDPVPTAWSPAVIASLFREWVARIDYRRRVPRYLMERA